MAEGLENLVNVDAPSAGYPWGNIRDNGGSGNGTPLDKVSHADYHQTFRKALALADITPNGTPDNSVNGYQYIEALDKIYKNYAGFIGTSTSTALVFSAINKLVLTGGAAAVTHTLPDSTLARDGDTVNFINVGTGTVDVIPFATDTILNNPGQMKSLDYIEFIFFAGLGTWVANKYKITPAPVTPIFVFNTISIALSSATSDILKFQTNESGDASLYNISNGRFTPTVAGVYELTWSVIYKTNGTPSQFYAGTNARKNGVQIGFITDRQDVYTTSDYLTLSGTVIVEANGTDYFDIQVYSSVAVAKTIYGNFHAKKIQG